VALVERHVGEHVVLGLVHRGRHAWEALAQVVGNSLPFRMRLFFRLLGEGGARPSWASLITSLTPRRPRSVKLRRNLVRNGSASDGPTAMPSTSRRPSAFAPTAIMTATDMILPPSRILT
jgi:hypothetical protein